MMFLGAMWTALRLILMSYFGISSEGQNVVEQASQSTKRSKKRSKDFSIKDDNMLVLAWLEVGI
jgi:hypothetical protein